MTISAFWKAATAVLPIALLALPAPQAALAQTTPTSTKLVGNMQATTEADSTTELLDFAQAFTTGSNVDGYMLTQVDINFQVAVAEDPGSVTQIDYCFVEIWRANASGAPEQRMTSWGDFLFVSGPPQDGIIEFTPIEVPDQMVHLEPDTTYVVVCDFEGFLPTLRTNVAVTTSDDEDTDSAAGWSVGDGGFSRAHDATEWTRTANAGQIAVHGYAIDAPNLSTAELDGNTLRLTFDEPLLDEDSEALFLLFSYTVDGVSRNPVASEVAGSTILLTRDWPHQIDQIQANRVTSSQTVTVSYIPRYGTRIRDLEGMPAAIGFTDEAVTVNTVAPSLAAATAAGARLTLAYDEPLDADAAPKATAFTVKVDSTTVTDPLSNTVPVSVSGSTVVLTLATAVTTGQTVTVSYDPGTQTAGDRIQDLNANEAAAFTDEAVSVQSLDATLSALSATDAGDTALTLDPATFSPSTYAYGTTVGETVTQVAVTATVNHVGAVLSGSLTRAGGAAEDVPMTSGAPAALSGLAPGGNVLTITVTSEGGATQDYTLTLTVTAATATAMRQEAVEKVLAATGVRVLSSALDNVGPRLGSAPGPSLTLAGQAVNLAGPVEGPPCEADVFGRDECRPDMRGASALDLLASSAFSLAAGASGEAADPAAPRWAVWGRGDAGSFEGSPDGMRYEGKTLAGWLGVDARAGRWVAGVALSRGESEADYALDADGGAGSGRIETTLTSVYPYGRWSLADGTELRGIVGAGTGEARHRSKEEGAASETADLTMWMASAGVRRALPPSAGFDLAVRGEASLVRMETGDGAGSIDGLSAQGWRGRAGLEGSKRFALSEGGSLEPFAEAGVRQDGGDGLKGTGVEFAGGVRYGAKRILVEIRGRWLAAHTEDGVKEQGVSATVRLDADALGRGLSFALTPRWGSSAAGSGALWKDELPRPGSAAGSTVDARLGYGVGMPRGALLTPFVETGFAEHRRFRLGARYEAWRALSLEVSGERRERAAADPEHAVGLDLTLRF